MKLAVFTDIHGNLEALKTIINDIKSKNVDEIICLGDTIGLGSESKECLDLIIENNIKMVLGNHELCALYGTDIDSSINSNVQKEHYKWIRESLTTKEIDFLKKCPLYYECNISYNNIIKNKKIIFSHYLLEDTSKLYPFEKNNLKNDVNLWIKYNNEDITYIVGHLHKSFNENEVDGISEDYIEAIDKLTNIIVLDSGGCTIDNNTSYMLIDINKSLKFSKINLTYDYNKFINKELEKEFPKNLAEEWDNVGLLVGDNKREIKKIQISLDATEVAIDNAIKNSVDMIVTHHPMIFKGVKSIDNSTILGRKIIKLIENRINLYTLHTNLDSAFNGLNDYILKQLGIKESKIIDENINGLNCGIGRIYRLEKEISILEYINFLKEKLEIENVRVVGDVRKNIKKIALVNGSGMSYWRKVKKLDVDLFITGDIGYHEALDAKENNLSLIDIGHFESEKCFVKLLKTYFEKMDIDVIIYNDGPVFKNY